MFLPYFCRNVELWIHLHQGASTTQLRDDKSGGILGHVAFATTDSPRQQFKDGKVRICVAVVGGVRFRRIKTADHQTADNRLLVDLASRSHILRAAFETRLARIACAHPIMAGSGRPMDGGLPTSRWRPGPTLEWLVRCPIEPFIPSTP